jgi:hypothetical protein
VSELVALAPRNTAGNVTAKLQALPGLLAGMSTPNRVDELFNLAHCSIGTSPYFSRKRKDNAVLSRAANCTMMASHRWEAAYL